MTRRLVQLLVGLVLYGLTLALIIRASVGNAAWDVLHQGIAKHTSLTIGEASFGAFTPGIAKDYATSANATALYRL